QGPSARSAWATRGHSSNTGFTWTASIRPSSRTGARTTSRSVDGLVRSGGGVGSRYRRRMPVQELRATAGPRVGSSWNSHVGDLMDIDTRDHAGLNVTNVERSAAWYHDILGFELVHKFTHTWMVGRGSMRLGLLSDRRPARRRLGQQDCHHPHRLPHRSAGPACGTDFP